MKITAILVGFGNVSQGFVSVLTKKRNYLREAFDLEMSIVGAVEGREGKFHSAFSKNGLDLEMLLETKRKAGRISGYPNAGGDASPFDLIRESEAQILLEATPTNLANGEPGLAYIRAALNAGMHVVTSNKGPLIFGLRELRTTARAKGLDMRYSAAVAGALPIMPTLYYTLMGCQVNSIEGVLSATTNYILTQMVEKGVGMRAALSEAQAMGIAEADPSIDLQGYDTAVKLLIAANSCMGCCKKISDLRVSGIENVGAETIRAATTRGRSLKLIGRARRIEADVEISVGLQEVAPASPFYNVNGTQKAVMFQTDLLGQVTIFGCESNPEIVAGAMLRDILNIVHDSQGSQRVSTFFP